MCLLLCTDIRRLVPGCLLSRAALRPYRLQQLVFAMCRRFWPQRAKCNNRRTNTGNVNTVRHDHICRRSLFAFCTASILRCGEGKSARPAYLRFLFDFWCPMKITRRAYFVIISITDRNSATNIFCTRAVNTDHGNTAVNTNIYCPLNLRQYCFQHCRSVRTHKPLYLDWWNFAWTCTLKTSRSLLNIKVIG